MIRHTQRMSGAAGCAMAALTLIVSAGCGGGDRGNKGATADTSTSAATPSAGAPAAAPAAPAGPLTEASITPQMVALGDSIFSGQAAGGICYTCHGQKAVGTPTAPNLTDQQWINGDGSLAFITNTIINGVPHPKQHPAPMPPFGQAFNDDQIRALTAYVYSLSHPNVGGARS